MGLILAGITYTKIIEPFLIELRNWSNSLIHDWKFYTFISVILFISILIRKYYLKKKAEKRAWLNEQHEKYMKEKEAEEKRIKKLYAHLEPKPKELPPFATSGWTWNSRKEETKKVDINVDLSKGYYKRNRLNREEIQYLIQEGYKELSYRSICSGKKENYLLKPRFNESLSHMIIIYDISNYLDKKGIRNDMFTTKMPDIVMYFGRKEIALEVETGTVMSNMKKFGEKLDLLKENYGDNWYFIVTNRNLISKYRKYGKVIDPRYIKGQLDKILKSAKK